MGGTELDGVRDFIILLRTACNLKLMECLFLEFSIMYIHTHVEQWDKDRLFTVHSPACSFSPWKQSFFLKKRGGVSLPFQASAGGSHKRPLPVLFPALVPVAPSWLLSFLGADALINSSIGLI
jgi:hypothetical protein